MNQKEFLIAYDLYSLLPKKLKKDLLKQLKSLIALMVVNSDPVILPFLGKIFVEFQPSRVRYNVRAGTVTTYPAKNKIKMSRFKAQQQVLYPDWNPEVTFKTFSEYPSSSIAYKLRDWSGYDLLTCQDFMRTFVQIIIDTANSDEKVIISGIGTFKPIEIQNPYLDPVSSICSRGDAAYSSSVKRWVWVGRDEEGAKIDIASPNGVFVNVYENGILYLSGVAYSPILDIFVAVGFTESGFVYMTSADGEVWTYNDGSPNFWAICIRWNSNLGLFVCGGYDFGDGAIAYSADGLSWNFAFCDELTQVWHIAISEDGSKIIACGNTDINQRVAYSVDVINWTRSAEHFTNLFVGAYWFIKNGAFYIAVSEDVGGNIYKSVTGEFWEVVSGAPFGISIALEGGGYFEKLGYVMRIDGLNKFSYSLDGENWEDPITIGGDGISFLRNNGQGDYWIAKNATIAAPSYSYSRGAKEWFVSRLSTEPPTPPTFRKVISYRPSTKLERSVN